MYKPALIAGIISGMLAVIIGAFGAHTIKPLLLAIPDRGPDLLQAFHTGVSYQFYHVFAMLATGILYMAFPGKSLVWANFLFILGTICFSGSLYLMGMLAVKGMTIGKVGILTPIGGLFFIAGWISLLLGILKKS